MKHRRREPITRLSYRSTRYIIGLAFLKHLSDGSMQSAEAPLRGAARYIVPPEAEWERVRSDPTGKTLLRAMSAIGSYPENKDLEDVFIPLGLPDLAKDPELLQQLISLLNADDKTTYDRVLSTTVDRLIQQGVRQAGWRGGEHYTPPDLALLLAELLNPQPASTIYDPACGTGTLLSVCCSHALRMGGEGRAPRLYGQEIDPETAALARVNIFSHVEASTSITTGNTLLHPSFTNESGVQAFDYVVANPPLGLRLDPATLQCLQEDPFERFSLGVPRRTIELAFLQHAIASLKDGGRAVVVVSPGALVASGQEENIRRSLVELDIIEAIISLPANLLFNAGTPAAIMVLNKAKPENLKGKILFVFAEEDYEQGRLRRHISEQQRKKIVGTVLEMREHLRFSVVVPTDEISGPSFQLAPSQYVDIIGRDTFMGGSVHWTKLSDLGTVFQGSRVKGQLGTGSGTPIIRGRNLSAPRITVDDLDKVDLDDSTDYVYSEVNDILVQRIGQRPRAYLIDESVAGVLIRDSVYVVRLGENGPLARYLVDYLNSDPGQAFLGLVVRGAGAPTMPLSDLRDLSIPLPNGTVVEMVSDLHDVEQELFQRIDAARIIRHRLFSIEDPEQVDSELNALNVETQLLSDGLVQVEGLEFQVGNYYPFPLAFPYRTLSAIQEPSLRYDEQLRVVENIVAFLGTAGLSLAAHVGALTAPSGSEHTANSKHMKSEDLRAFWQGGISLGDWLKVGSKAALAMRREQSSPEVGGFASLWFRGRGQKISDLAKTMKDLGDERNDHAHNRGPKTPYAFEKSANELQTKVDKVLKELSLLVQYPLRLVQDLNVDWRSYEITSRTLLYTGDHPGMHQELVTLPRLLPKDKLYLTLPEEGAWVSLYPLINVLYCPQCGSRETYFVDRWDGPGEQPVLKSFERGHLFEDAEINAQISEHLDHWVRTHLGGEDVSEPA